MYGWRQVRERPECDFSILGRSLIWLTKTTYMCKYMYMYIYMYIHIYVSVYMYVWLDFCQNSVHVLHTMCRHGARHAPIRSSSRSYRILEKGSQHLCVCACMCHSDCVLQYTYCNCGDILTFEYVMMKFRVLDDSFIRGTWLIHTWPMTHSYVAHDSFIRGPWLIHMRHMIHACVAGGSGGIHKWC